MEEYLKIFIDEDYPEFIDKYLETNTLSRLKDVSQFCGCDYTKLYRPLFFYSRFDHSLVVANMTWHFTHDKESTIAALLHDSGTPCFAHCIDYVLGDYLKQESSEKDIVDIISDDKKVLENLEKDGINLENLKDLSKYPILENKSPKLCTDRLDGVLHTCYVWLHTHDLEEIKEVYDNIDVLTNEEGKRELGFKNKDIAEKFTKMTYVYAKELKGNTDKFVMKYISEVVKKALEEKFIKFDDLYTKKEKDIINIFNYEIPTWRAFNDANNLIRTEEKPENFYVSFETKKRNVIPLVKTEEGEKRIEDVSEVCKNIYLQLENYRDTKYAYINSIKNI